MFNKWKLAEELADLIVEFSKGEINRNEAELTAYRYYSKKTLWDLIKPAHTSMSQLANNFVIGHQIANAAK